VLSTLAGLTITQSTLCSRSDALTEDKVFVLVALGRISSWDLNHSSAMIRTEQKPAWILRVPSELFLNFVRHDLSINSINSINCSGPLIIFSLLLNGSPGELSRRINRPVY
jgi:hypothetical protein